LCSRSRRSICRALIFRSWLSTPGLIGKCFLTQGSQGGINALSRTDHGYPAASHTPAKINTTFAP
jgi:hypothetical protein